MSSTNSQDTCDDSSQTKVIYTVLIAVVVALTVGVIVAIIVIILLTRRKLKQLKLQ